jgi:hypothetical protein
MQKTEKAEFTNLDEMLRSRAFEMFQSDRLGSDLFLSDPERAERIHEYAESGSNGSTHAEVIEDWRDFLNTLKTIDPEFPDDGGEITEETLEAISAEIDKCEDWHEKNGSLNSIIN